MNNEYIKKFYKELSYELEGDYKIIIEPNRNLTEDWIEYDQVKWELDEPIQNLVNKLLKDNTLNFEEKILTLYEFICLSYIYDVNVLYFFKRDTSDLNNIKYIAVDWYGRIIDEKWKENRKKHNRRVCYEFARLYAKAINELLKDNHNLEAVMVGDRENLHYVVGLTGNDYSVLLDLDNFNKLKDLTRLKLGLTINGITILRDDFGKFQKALDNFNKDRLDELAEVKEIEEKFKGKDDIKYFKSVLQILTKYNIDSQGFFEYMRAKIEQEKIKIEKIWKEVKGSSERRYLRCLIFSFNYKTYLLDSDEKTLSEVDKEKLDKEAYIFNPEEHEYHYYGG